jgi:hypothetical protein
MMDTGDGGVKALLHPNDMISYDRCGTFAGVWWALYQDYVRDGISCVRFI